MLLLVGLLGALRLSGSSLAIYATWHGVDEEDAGVLVGPSRGIRSDEWAVRTPWVLRQAELGGPKRVAGGVGTHDVAVIADLPTASWELLLRPHTASALVLDEQRAFAVEWWLLAAVQLLGVYALLYALTRRPAVSALAALLLTLSPATQWWWAPGTFTTTGYGSLSTALLIFAYRASDSRRRIALSVASGWAMAAFLTSLYVPWQVGTALVVAPIGLTTLLSDLFRHENRRRALTSLAVVCGVGIGVALLLFGSFAVTHRATIRTITATEYPGDREARGGGASLAVLWGSAFDYYSTTSQTGDVNGTNQSENSSALVFLLPVALACFALASAGRLRDHATVPPLLGCLAGGAALLAWMLFPVPSALGRFVFLHHVAPERLLLPLGLASVLALGLLVTYQLDTGRRVGRGTLAVSVGAFTAALLWGATAYRLDGVLIDFSLAVLFVVIVSVGVALTLWRWPISGFGILVAFTFWQATLINPVQRGTDPITESPLRKAIDEVEVTAPPNAGWVAYHSDATVKGTLTASGVNHVTGISPYPDADTWRILDPESRFRDVWNRYAHVSFVPGAVGSPIEFKLVGPDNLSVTVDPCSPALTRLGVEFFVTQNTELSGCSSVVRKVPVGTGYAVLYRRVAPPQAL